MRIRALALRIFRQFLHDKRTLAMMLVAPLLILWLVSMVFNGDTYRPKIGAVQLPDALVQQLEKRDADVSALSPKEAAQSLREGRLDAVVSLENAAPSVVLEGSDPAKSKAVLFLLQKTMQEINPADVQAPNVRVSYLHGSESMAAFDNFGPVLIGFFAFFFVFLISGVSFLRERTGGTLERLLASPLRRWEIVAGYVLGFAVFTLLQACLIVWFSIYVLNIMMVGSFLYVLLVTLLLSMTALTLGILLSAFANNEFQMIQFIPLVIVPQVFFSGLFSTDNMAAWLRGLGSIMPLFYGADALRNIMIRGAGWSAIATDLYVLAGFSVAFMAANVLALRKYRKL